MGIIGSKTELVLFNIDSNSSIASKLSDEIYNKKVETKTRGLAIDNHLRYSTHTEIAKGNTNWKQMCHKMWLTRVSIDQAI